MKIPAVALAAAFGGGIVLGLQPQIGSYINSRLFLMPAIISAGEQNPYGHPSPALLERLEESGIRVLRTDRDGAVRVLTDGKEIRVSCYVECGSEGELKVKS
jgi:hypothetical protein